MTSMICRQDWGEEGGVILPLPVTVVEHWLWSELLWVCGGSEIKASSAQCWPGLFSHWNNNLAYSRIGWWEGKVYNILMREWKHSTFPFPQRSWFSVCLLGGRGGHWKVKIMVVFAAPLATPPEILNISHGFPTQKASPVLSSRNVILQTILYIFSESHSVQWDLLQIY